MIQIISREALKSHFVSKIIAILYTEQHTITATEIEKGNANTGKHISLLLAALMLSALAFPMVLAN